MTAGSGAADLAAPIPPALLREAVDALPAQAWSQPSTFAATELHAGYRAVTLVKNCKPQPHGRGFAFALDQFTPVKSAWLSWIDPQGFVGPHRDAGPYLERWQIPIQPAGEFVYGEQRFTAEAGVPFRVQNWREHWVANWTDRARIHIVLDRDVLLDRPNDTYETFPPPPEVAALIANTGEGNV